MSIRAHSSERRERLPSTSSSSVVAPDESPAVPPSLSMLPNSHTMDRRQGRELSRSTPALANEVEERNNSAESDSEVRVVHPPRHHSLGAVASHFLAQSPSAYGGQTWMDFLRESGAESTTTTPQTHSNAQSSHPHPPSAASSRYSRSVRMQRHSEAASRSIRGSERKRRLTTAESPIRRPSPLRMRANTDRGHAGNPGASRADPIVLDASSPPPPGLPRPSVPSHHSHSSFLDSRRENEIVMPPWQPDSEVSDCPVCGTRFTFFYRKHHCRKCGRVVCSACSPHRITIPRQFIVHPPSDISAGGSILDFANDDNHHGHNTVSHGMSRNPALGGGEEVRVCNPCVPDPNLSPPPQPQRTQHNGRLFDDMNPPRSQFHSRNPQTIPPQQAPGPVRIPGASTPSPYHAYQNEATWIRPFGSMIPHGGRHDRAPSDDLFPAQEPSTQQAIHRTPAELSAYCRGEIQTPPQARPHTRPHRIAEEDECPVCGDELPAKGPDGDDSARTQHVTDCLALHSAGTPPGASLLTQRARGMSIVRGTAVWSATEKDCFDAGGNQVECIICFEDLEPGDRLARLPCWCKFHDSCIRRWFEMKGRGACPTHASGLQ